MRWLYDLFKGLWQLSGVKQLLSASYELETKEQWKGLTELKFILQLSIEVVVTNSDNPFLLSECNLSKIDLPSLASQV